MDDDGQMMEACLYYKLSDEPSVLDELKHTCVGVNCMSKLAW